MLSDIEFKMLQHGHKIDYKVIEPSQDLMLVAALLSNSMFNKEKIKSSTLQRIRKESEEFMKSNFNIHKISHATVKEMKKFLKPRRNLSIQAMINEYNRFGKEVDPYELPIQQISKKYWYGYLAEIGPNQAIEEFYLKTKTIFSHITLSKVITNCTPQILSHEIAHSQLNSIKGSIKSYYNYEVIPIFVEYLHSLDKDYTLQEFNLEKQRRFNGISKYIYYLNNSYEEKNSSVSRTSIIYTMYLESEMKALRLFDIYLNSSVSTKKEILSFIQRIFDGDKTVEELLSKYNIDLRGSCEFFKQTVFVKQKRRG